MEAKSGQGAGLVEMVPSGRSLVEATLSFHGMLYRAQLGASTFTMGYAVDAESWSQILELPVPCLKLQRICPVTGYNYKSSRTACYTRGSDTTSQNTVCGMCNSCDLLFSDLSLLWKLPCLVKQKHR